MVPSFGQLCVESKWRMAKISEKPQAVNHSDRLGLTGWPRKHSGLEGVVTFCRPHVRRVLIDSRTSVPKEQQTSARGFNPEAAKVRRSFSRD
jgi:hypothetical protein